MNDGPAYSSVFEDPAFLLWVAIAIAALFLGVLAFDLVRRRKRLRRSRGQREGFWRRLGGPFRATRDLLRELRRLSHHRSQRKQLEERVARQLRK